MNRWLKNHFQSDELPPTDILRSSYEAACRIVLNPARFPNADFATLTRLIKEIESDPEICNII